MTRIHTSFNSAKNKFDAHLNLLLSALCHTWLGIKLHDEYLAALDKNFSAWQRSNNALFSNVCAQLLAKYGVWNSTLNVEKKALYQAFLTKQAEQGIDLNLLGLITPKEKWLTALEQLISLDDNQKVAEEDPMITGSQNRLIWLVDTQEHRTVEVRDQKRNKHSWSKGRPVSLQRLSESPEEFPYLTPADKKICQAIDVSYDNYSWNQREYLIYTDTKH